MPVDHILPIACQVLPVAAADIHGVMTYGGAVDTRCRIEPANRQVKLDKDQVVNVNAVSFFRPDEDIDVNYRVIVGDKKYLVVKKEILRDVTGYAMHIECMLHESK